MSGVFVPFTPINGQLPDTTPAPIVTAPGGQNLYIKQLLLFNENAATQTILLYLMPTGGTPLPFRQLVLEQNESAAVLEDGESITLTAGDEILAVTTTASAVDFTATGVQET